MMTASRAILSVVVREVVEEGTAVAVAAAVTTVAGDDPAMADTTRRLRPGEWVVSSWFPTYFDANDIANAFSAPTSTL